MTLSAATIAMLQSKDLDTIVLCPQCAIKAFKRELTEKLKVRFNLLTSGKPIFQPGARIHVITHTSMKKYQDYVDRLHNEGKKLLLMIDEAQIMHDSNNQLYQILAQRRHYFNIVWEMTATPLGNSLTGLYWLLFFLNPKIVGSLEDFKERYFIRTYNPVVRWCGKYPHKYKRTFREEVILGYKNLDRLAEILKDYVIIKQKSYNLKWHYHKFNITPEETEQYLMAGQGLKRETSEKNFAVRIHDLQMVIDNLVIPIDRNVLELQIKDKLKEMGKEVDDEIVKKLVKQNLEKMNEHRKTTIMKSNLSSKEKEYLKVVADEIKQGHPVLTYLDYSDAVDRLEMLLNKTKSITGVKQVLKVTGSVSLKEREVVEESIKEGTVVLITSAGTESINLQKSNSMIFYDVPFSVLTFIQAVGRITRMDSKYSEQHIHIIEATGTIDSYKRLLINMNSNLIETIFGGIETLPVEMLKIDKSMQGVLKKKLLWCFDNDSLLNEEEINILLKEAMEERNRKRRK
ncbi:MAG: hypothetical protein IJF92_00660 [Bacilli bacterium]|nr:hypothetical protein [Bacilli bacterium]MBQ3307675.1 hypothetical protein [Bacilli bacterium]